MANKFDLIWFDIYFKKSIIGYLPYGYLPGIYWVFTLTGYLPDGIYMVFTGHLPRQIPHRYSPRGFYVFPSTRYRSMWAERERQNFRSSLKPISVTPAPRSVPRSVISRSRSSQFFHTRSPLRSRSEDFWPAPLLSRSAPMFQAANWKKWTDFSFNVTYRPICIR